jgi:mycofactocin precursor
LPAKETELPFMEPIVEEGVVTPEAEAMETGEDVLTIEDEIILEDFDIDGICGVY